MQPHRYIAVFLASLHLCISIGFAVNLHFCGGELENVSTLLTNAVCAEETVADKCCSEKKDFSSECCDDEQIDLTQVDDETLLNVKTNLSALWGFTLQEKHNFSFYNTTKIKGNLPFYTYQSNAPPLYKLYCTYIHYA